MNGKEVTVSHGCIISLINCVIKSQYVSANKRIITINDDHHLSRITVFVNSHVKVVHGLSIFFVDDDLNVLLRYFFIFEIFFHILSCFIRWTIINVDYMIIVIILHENGVQVSQVKTIFNIVVWGCNDTERKLISSIKVNVVFFVEILFVFCK